MVNVHRHPENTVVEGIEVYYYPQAYYKWLIGWNINDFNVNYFLIEKSEWSFKYLLKRRKIDFCSSYYGEQY